MYAKLRETIVDDVATTVIDSVGPLPRAARRLDTGEWVMQLDTVELQEACGYFAVVDVPKPADVPDFVWDASVELDVDNIPTVVWTQRAMTQEELDAQNSDAEQTTKRDQARTAYQDNRAYLAISSPNNSQIRDQVDALTRQMNGMIKLIVPGMLLEAD